MLKDKLTIIIPLHNRKKYINNLLDYYSGLDCDIVVLDSSEKKTEIKKYKNVKYIFEPNKLYYEKLYDGLCNISTPYVIDIPDDSIVLKNSLIECVDYLENNEDYSFVDGLYLHINEVNSNTFRLSSFGYRGVISCHQDKNPNFSNIEERILFNTTKFYKMNNHSVVRTNVLREIYKFPLDNIDLRPIEYFDRIWCFIALIYGNYKSLPIPYMLRRDDKMIDTQKNYPKELRKNVPWGTIVHGDKLINLALYLKNITDIDKDKCIEITYKSFRHLKINAYYGKHINFKEIVKSDKKYLDNIKIYL
jgi:glycosyltransferase domain-containing protein